MNNPKINEFGTKRWYNENGQLHREDGPAVIFEIGTKKWFQNGKKHRIDGPAVEFCNRDKEYWLLDKYYENEKVYRAAAKILKWSIEISKQQS